MKEPLSTRSITIMQQLLERPAAVAVKRVPTCALCAQEILSVRVRCADCDPAIELCLPCLATGREAPRGSGGAAAAHRRSHRYRVLDNTAAMHLFERERPRRRAARHRRRRRPPPPAAAH